MVLLTLIFLFCSTALLGQTDSEMYKAYLAQDMSVWSDYIHKTNWDKLTNAKKITFLNYSYGYIAYSSSLPEADSQKLNEQFLQRLNQMKGQMEEAERLTYLSSYYAYSLTLNKVHAVSQGMKALKNSDLAVQTDSLNPLALALKGNVLFYSPSLVGGDKAKALIYLQKAEKQFRKQNLTKENWNYRALQLTIAQCYEKTGNKQKAIDYCKAVLKEEPNFSYIKKEYLPYLLGEKKNLDDTSTKIATSILQ